MGKIGILTYHTGYNYGASLQAYALMTTIKKYNRECEIINFETEEFVATREMFCRRVRRLKELVKVATRIPYRNSLIRRQKLFDKFTEECLDTSALYRTEKEVVDNISDYDCIVCGSDQIWNLSNNDAPAANLLYYLNFPKTQRRVSYAASFGGWVKEADTRAEEIIPLLKLFDMVSIRELSGKEYLDSKGIDCEVVLDPTLLLDKEEYEEICAQRLIEGKYILMFGWNTNDDLINVAKKASRELGVPIVNIVPPPRGLFCGIKRKLDVGPSEFLSMIKNAEFVVTNSFHGTVFSTIFNKDYVSVVSGKADLRMQSILEQLGLEKHLLTPENIEIEKLIDTDYSDVQSKLNKLREKSIEFLKRAIEV